MLQELKISNFLSIRDEVELSFEATKDKTFESTHVVEVAPGVRLLRFAMIMGANASGKSNLLYAIEFLRSFWFSRTSEVDESTGCMPFMLDNDMQSKPSKFEIRFWTKGVKYWYVLVLDGKRVYDERLYYYKNKSVQPTLIVRRDWMRNGILPIIEPNTQVYNVAKQRLRDDANLRTYMLDFIKQADFNITDLQSEEPKLTGRTRNEQVNMQFVHTVKNNRGEEQYLMSPELQSLGTKRTLGLETAIYEAIHSGALINVDEFDSSLHPDLLEFTIQRFLQEKSESQMIISTHYDPLLATVDDLIRKDNVWFTEKGEDGASSLYSLTDFKGLGKMSSTSIRNAYRHGQFGALPNI
jgi:hypothetical protein